MIEITDEMVSKALAAQTEPVFIPDIDMPGTGRDHMIARILMHHSIAAVAPLIRAPAEAERDQWKARAEAAEAEVAKWTERYLVETGARAEAQAAIAAMQETQP